MTTETHRPLYVTPETWEEIINVAARMELGTDECLHRLAQAWNDTEAGSLATVQREVAELRDELHELSVTFRRHQAKALLRDVDDASEPSIR